MSFNVTEVEGTGWDKYYLEMSRLVASKSQDRSTKCGCVLVKDNAVVSTGYNGFPRGTEDYDNEKKHERPEKYYWFEHSERNAIFNAAKHGHATLGTVAYVTGPPCVDCTRAMIQCGVTRVVIPVKHNWANRNITDDIFKHQFVVCEELMKNAGVAYEMVDID